MTAPVRFAVALCLGLAGAPATLHAQDAGQLIEDARAARVRGDFAAAETMYLAASARSPTDAAILMQLALVQGFQSKLDAARDTIDRAEALAPADLDIALAKARILAWRGDYAAAEAALARVRADRPDDADAAVLEGRIAYYQQRYDSADRAFADALARQPDLVDALVGRGDVARARGDEAAAMAFFRQARALEPASADIADRLARRAETGRKRWRLDIAAGVSALSRTALSDWSEQTAQLSREMDGWRLFARVNHARRFNRSDAGFDVGAAWPAASAIEATLEAGATPGDDFLPAWRLRGQLDARVADGGAAVGRALGATTLTGEGWVRRYRNGTVKAINAGMRQGFAGDRASVSARFINTFGADGNHTTGWAVGASAALGDRFTLRADYADAPESESGIVADTRTVSGGLTVALTDDATVTLSALRERREGAYVRKDVTVALGWRF
ncbi:MAG: YaiO family outer membrane beta-barrel protein [Rhodospirillaceae bacterium]|nr:YaiO family outer membrane beta-barrel protein [Rhodospirillaceae bacterium]